MAIDLDYLLAREWPEITHRYTEKDSMLYALGVGLGRDPLNQGELRFVYEDGHQANFSQLGYALGSYRNPPNRLAHHANTDPRRLYRLHLTLVLPQYREY